MLTQEQINEIAEKAMGAKPSGPKRVLAAKAISLAMKQITDRPLAFGDAPDSSTVAVPTAPVLICVSGPNRITAEVKQKIWPRLAAAKEAYGAFEVITFGGPSQAEDHAATWCQRNDIVHRAFGLVYNVPQPGGWTVLDSNAVRTRNNRMLAYMQQAKVVLSVLFGDRDGGPQWDKAKDRHEMIRRAFPPAEQTWKPGVPDIAGAVQDAAAAVGASAELVSEVDDFEAAMREAYGS